MKPDLLQRLEKAYDRCKIYPEISRNPDGTFTVKGDAYLALLELRALVPEIQVALSERDEFVKIERMD